MKADRAGLLSAFLAYAFWGVAPIYFMWVQFASPVEVLSHRILWAWLLLVPAMLLLGQLKDLRALTKAKVGWLVLSAALLATNWLVFVWALFNERMVETSLGYYINPLMTVFLGVVFLAERPRVFQWVSVIIAAIAILHELLTLGEVPVAGLTLAVSFALYGLVRKQVGVPSFLGLTVETSVMAPFALAFIVMQMASGSGAVSSGEFSNLALLALGGPVTIFPLVCFAYAALRVPFTMLGFIQYVAPSITLVLAVTLYDQELTPERLTTFVLIWLALAVFSAESLYHVWRSNQSKTDKHATG